jgi:hypothetical protein
MAEAYLKDQPLLAVDGLVEQAAWHPSVQGIAPTVQTIILFDKAWIKK